MAYNELLANRIREALVEQDDVVEKKMFSGVTFMVNGKMCISVSHNDIMCRIDPAIAETELEKSFTRAMIHNGRIMKGYLYVEEEGFKSQENFDRWIKLCLDFNKVAKASRKK
jgi:TfoX/Sxy family transcriptional regulator of competence genes